MPNSSTANTKISVTQRHYYFKNDGFKKLGAAGISSSSSTFFAKKIFMFDEMALRNTSECVIFLEYEKETQGFSYSKILHILKNLVETFHIA